MKMNEVEAVRMTVKNKKLEALFEKIEQEGWSIVEEGENEYRLGKRSPYGQDFNITVKGKTESALIESVYEEYQNFDVSEETYIWLDNTGHGINGAPYEMKDVLKDMEACENMIFALYDVLL